MSLNTNKKSIFYFILFMVLGGLAGFSSAFFAGNIDLSNIEPSETLYSIIFYIGAAISLILILVTIVSMIKINRTIKSNKDIDEYTLDTVTHKNLTIILSTSTLLNVFTLGWIVVLILYVEKLPSTNTTLISYLLFAVIITITSTALPIIAFRFYNRIYKTRQLDVLSPGISKHAFNHLDECEKTIAYKAAFKSFKVLDGLMFFIVILLMIIGLLLNIDTILAVIIVTTLLIVSKSIYFIEVYKLEKSN
ncbi:MAG: DUF3169 family protein [Clostridium sp.]